MAIIPDDKLEKIFKALDRVLGDSDPMLPDDMTDEEIYLEEPLFWAAKELGICLIKHQAHKV